MTNPTLERAARAAARADSLLGEIEWKDISDEWQQNYLETARAVLMAVRDRADLSYAANVNWQNRVDEILAEGE